MMAQTTSAPSVTAVITDVVAAIEASAMGNVERGSDENVAPSNHSNNNNSGNVPGELHDRMRRADIGQVADSGMDPDDDDDDDDDMTIIVLDHSSSPSDPFRLASTRGGISGSNQQQQQQQQQQQPVDWLEQAGPEMEQRRRNVLLRELRRVQRLSFIQFALLCLIPSVLLMIVILTVIGEDETCNSDVTVCHMEPRTFINAFTTRCICDPVPVQRDN